MNIPRSSLEQDDIVNSLIEHYVLKFGLHYSSLNCVLALSQTK